MYTKILQYVFYILLCVPVLAAGIYFFLCLCGDIKSIKRAEKLEKQEKARETERRRVFEEGYSRRRNG